MSGYGTDLGLEAWAAANGYELLELEPALAVLRQRGSDYVDAKYGARFPGVPTGGIDQERAFPRIGACAYGSTIPDDTIPLAVINASYAAAFHEYLNPGSLAVAVVVAGAVKRVKVGVIEEEVFAGSGNAVADAIPLLSAVEGLLAPFLQPENMPAIGIWVV